ncbi:histidine phosphatase superfamily [Chaetomium tenue]|uniref:Histidine phosphatase superfamily n=1 Tax=Chaetomium tenue TaxID=1854479 RepID=A0ACB7PEV1_9PEZI|nr:histidine phosphatase superfamily [Chaetomium globosum]
MPTYIHLVRHAQGFHNLCAANHILPDPDLTPLGNTQCATLAKSFPFQSQITHLVASPLRRTLYTCLLSFEPALQQQNTTTSQGDTTAKKPLTVVALPELQEVSPLPCDTGSDIAALTAEFGPRGDVDLELVRAVAAEWTVKTGESRFAPVMARLEARARAARVWLRELGRAFEREHPGVDAHVGVVTHGGILHFLTQDWDGMNPQAGTGWGNTEWRSYEFVEGTVGGGEDDGEARLRETGESWRRRRGSATGLTETEQMELRVAVEGQLVEEWGVDGGKL